MISLSINSPYYNIKGTGHFFETLLVGNPCLGRKMHLFISLCSRHLFLIPSACLRKQTYRLMLFLVGNTIKVQQIHNSVFGKFSDQ